MEVAYAQSHGVSATLIKAQFNSKRLRFLIRCQDFRRDENEQRLLAAGGRTIGEQRFHKWNVREPRHACFPRRRPARRLRHNDESAVIPNRNRRRELSYIPDW